MSETTASPPDATTLLESRPSTNGVEFRNINHWFVSDQQANQVLEDITFQVPDGQFMSIVGGSGCGKTTVLNMIAGLIKPTEGTIIARVGGKEVSLPSPQLGYMWARDSLLPWRRLQRNVEFGLEVRGIGKHERAERARKYIEMVGLAGAEKKFPSQLSHGMRQRGNLARLLTTEPRFLLMDEPFSALDAQTKGRMQQEFLTIWEADPRTVVYVTHDLTEAALLSDRVLVMGKGYIAYDVDVPFSRPRELDDLRFDAEFQEFNRHLWDLLQSAQKGERA